MKLMFLALRQLSTRLALAIFDLPARSRDHESSRLFPPLQTNNIASAGSHDMGVAKPFHDSDSHGYVSEEATLDLADRGSDHTFNDRIFRSRRNRIND